MPLAATTNPVTDDAAQRVEARDAVDAPFMDALREELGGRLLGRTGHIGCCDCAVSQGGQRCDLLGELGEVVFHRSFGPNGDQTLDATLAIDRSRDPDRLMRGTERRIASRLGRDHRAQLADRCDVGTDRGFGQFPIEVQPLLSLLGDPARDDLEGRLPEMLGKMITFGADVAVVEVDEDSLHRDDVVGFRLARARHRAGNDVEGQAILRHSLRLGHQLRR